MRVRVVVCVRVCARVRGARARGVFKAIRRCAGACVVVCVRVCVRVVRARVCCVQSAQALRGCWYARVRARSACVCVCVCVCVCCV